MQKNKNKKAKKIIIIYYIVIIILIIQGGYTFSKYMSISTSNAEIDVAQFCFKVDNEEQEIELNLADTILENSYSNDVIIPGTYGKIELNLDFSDIEVATNYRINLNKENTNIPENLKLYIDESNLIEFNGYTGMTELDTKTITREIYWKWNYTTTDETEQWMGKEINIALNIIAEQRTN